MACPGTMKFKLNKNKRIGQVLFVVEGLKTEPNLIYRIFCQLLGYRMERLYRNGVYKVFNKAGDPFSKVTVINTEESNIRFIDKDNQFLNRMFATLIEDYALDIDNTAVYYLFDRDSESNTDKQFIEDMLRRLESSRDTNPDWGQPGLLLLSYPCIEAFTGMNLLQGSIGYCWNNGVVTGSDLKAALQQDGLIQNKITEETLLHCMQELFASMEMIGVDTDEEPFMASVDHFGENNLTIYSWEENQYASRGQYGLLSLMILALLDLGLITVTYDE